VAASHELLGTISRALVGFISHSNPSVTFHHLLSRVLSLTGSEYGFIGEVVDAPGGGSNLSIYAVSDQAPEGPNRPRQPEDLPQRDWRELCAALIAANRPLLTDDLEILPLLRELVPGRALRNFAAIPIQRSEDLVGVLGMANRPGGYDQELVAFLEPLGNTCASIIEAYHSDQ